MNREPKLDAYLLIGIAVLLALLIVFILSGGMRLP